MHILRAVSSMASLLALLVLPGCAQTGVSSGAGMYQDITGLFLAARPVRVERSVAQVPASQYAYAQNPAEKAVLEYVRYIPESGYATNERGVTYHVTDSYHSAAGALCKVTMVTEEHGSETHNFLACYSQSASYFAPSIQN